VNVAIASAGTFAVATVATFLGDRLVLELDLVAMVVLGILGVRQSRSPEPGESGTMILLISLPAAVIGSLVALAAIAVRLMLFLRA
jgi:hypothetical protein